MTATATDSPEEGSSDQPILDRLADWTIAPRSPGFRWVFMLGVFAVATAGRFALISYIPSGYPFVLYYPAVALVGLVAGAEAGLGIALLSLGMLWFAFMPRSSMSGLHGSDLLALFLYGVTVLSQVGIIYLMHRALRRLAGAEAVARETAESRSLMFAELQHRVSNNLAVVSSLLSLQKREVADRDAARALEGAAVRVNVVSRLNRLLHDPQAQEIDFGAFLRVMVPDAVTAAGVGGRVSVTVEAEPVAVPADKAVPMGLVATELLSNALEHGFPEGRRGTVRVALETPRPGWARLTIRDDGVGLQPGFRLERVRSLGLMIAQQFAGQLGAELRLTDEGGVVSRLEVPLGK